MIDGRTFGNFDEWITEHDKAIQNKTIAVFEREIANLNRVDWTEQNLAIFAMNISEIIEQMKGE